MNSQGQAGEERAAQFLIAKGWQILARNFSVPAGELDLVACDGKTLVFVEVKTRTHETYGGPLAAVTKAKQARLFRAAVWFIKEKKLKFDSIRFDVVCVLPDRVELVPNAFYPPRTTL